MTHNKINSLLKIMQSLRHPENGCPWDIKQNFDTIAPYTVEEAYEVADAIERKDMLDLREELGDLLLQVVYHAQIAKEEEHFDFDDIVESISQKMIRRHPHVFGTDEERANGVQPGFWERIKAEEKKHKQHASSSNEAPSLLDGIPLNLPALMRAIKLQKQAAKAGFDWPELKQVFNKMHEELLELEEQLVKQEQTSTSNSDKVEEEFGDLLFVMANVARHLNIDAESALRAANHKFVRRFQYIEHALAEHGKSPEQASLEEMDKLWDKAKQKEKLVTD